MLYSLGFSEILLLFVFVLWLVYYTNRRKYLNQFAGIKGPKGWPIIGNYLQLRKRQEILSNGVKDSQTYGKTYKLFIGLEPKIMTCDAKLLEIVLGSNKLTKKSVDYAFFKRWFGDGLLTSFGAKWKAHRRILTPAFHYSILKDFVEVFEARGEILVENFMKDCGKDSVDVHQIFNRYTLDVICETAMGTAVDAQTNPDHEYMRAVHSFFDIVFTRVNNPLLRNHTLYKFSKLYQREIAVVKTLIDFSSGIIEKRREHLLQQKDVDVERDEFGKRKKMTFLDILLRSSINGEPLSNEDIREEVDTFLLEGHDTTAVALSFITYNVSNHPEIQAKAVQELEDVFQGDRTRTASIKDLQNLKYLEMIIKESLRLYPSVAFHARQVLEDIEYDGNVIPKGMSLIINQYALHRDPEVFPDPCKFDPERFNLDTQAKRHPYAYIPFSAGARNCIGQRFAMLELKSAMSKILRNFEFFVAKPVHTPALVFHATLISLNGIHVGIRKRA